MRGANVHPNAGRLVRARGHAAAWLVLIVLGTVGVAAAVAGSAWGANSSGPSGGTGPQPSGPPPSQHHQRTSVGPLSRTGMWIWYVSKSSGGSSSAIVAMAHRHAVGTVMIKTGDGSGFWSQFSSRLVAALHRGGLNVCAWQYVYGSHPVAEAEVGAQAVRVGADCLLIDAEGEYEGRYAAAQKYLRELRSLVGASFPVGLASFPYVDYHPGFPYSVFLGPGGAQFDVPQMYWRDIGTTTDAVYAHTYMFNTPYLRPIVPIGEVTGNPPPAQIERFRQLRRVYKEPAPSWWDWQEATARGWNAISATIPNLQGVTAERKMAFLSYKGKNAVHQGDLVVWAQEHLFSAGYRVKIDGMFGPGTRTAVQRFQKARGLPTTGQVNTPTWGALLRYPAATVTWTPQGAQTSRTQQAAGDPAAAHPAAGDQGLALSAPRSARIPARRYEIPAHLGRG